MNAVKHDRRRRLLHANAEFAIVLIRHARYIKEGSGDGAVLDLALSCAVTTW